MEKFSSFSYLVRNDFIYKDKIEVRVFFIYLDKGVVNKSLFLDKVHNKPERLYIADAKKIVNKMIENGSLEKYAESTLKILKKKRTLSIGLSIAALCAVVGGSVGGYMAYLNSRPAHLSPWYEYSDWWNYCSNGNPTSQATVNDIGKEVNLTVNNQVHKVRLIDVDKDKDSKGKTIHATFEFANLLSDENGYSLASLWQDTNNRSSANFDYLNSTIRKNLTGHGNGKIMWYEKDSATQSDRKKTVLDMLPSDLRSVLKIAKKKVNLKTTGSWVETDLTDELFLLSANEMNEQTTYAEVGEAYEYYKNATPSGEADSIRIKQQIKGADGAATDPISITDNAYGSGNSYAGYNSSIAGRGGLSRLRSPRSIGSRYAWMVGSAGSIYDSGVYDGAMAVAPAFCL